MAIRIEQGPITPPTFGEKILEILFVILFYVVLVAFLAAPIVLCVHNARARRLGRHRLAMACWIVALLLVVLYTAFLIYVGRVLLPRAIQILK